MPQQPLRYTYVRPSSGSIHRRVPETPPCPYAPGDPSEATIGIYQYGADNNYTFLEGKAGKI